MEHFPLGIETPSAEAFEGAEKTAEEEAQAAATTAATAGGLPGNHGELLVTGDTLVL